MNSVFITGGTGLLGEVFIRAFLENKYKVIFTSRNQDKIDLLKNKYKKYKYLYGCKVDFMQPEFISIINKFFVSNNLNDCPNYLINNARMLENLLVDDYKTISKENWLNEFEMNVVIPYKLAIYFANKENCNVKSIINISSIYSILAYNHYLCDNSTKIPINYGVTKAALNKLTKELAVRFLQENKKIRVNSVLYGGVLGRADEFFIKKYSSICPARKMLDETELAGHLLYLCSDLSKGLTGQNLIVDGGFSIW